MANYLIISFGSIVEFFYLHIAWLLNLHTIGDTSLMADIFGISVSLYLCMENTTKIFLVFNPRCNQIISFSFISLWLWFYSSVLDLCNHMTLCKLSAFLETDCFLPVVYSLWYHFRESFVSLQKRLLGIYSFFKDWLSFSHIN